MSSGPSMVATAADNRPKPDNYSMFAFLKRLNVVLAIDLWLRGKDCGSTMTANNCEADNETASSTCTGVDDYPLLDMPVTTSLPPDRDRYGSTAEDSGDESVDRTASAMCSKVDGRHTRKYVQLGQVNARLLAIRLGTKRVIATL